MVSVRVCVYVCTFGIGVDSRAVDISSSISSSIKGLYEAGCLIKCCVSSNIRVHLDHSTLPVFLFFPNLSSLPLLLTCVCVRVRVRANFTLGEKVRLNSEITDPCGND